MTIRLAFVDAVRMAEVCFGLALPTTLDELKKAFRKKAKQLHSDVGGSDAGFIKLKQAYDALLAAAGYLSGVFEGENAARELTTAEGHPLSGLGLGLGSMKNGRDCSRCQRKGYTEERGIEWKVCEHCDEFGMVSNKVPQMVPCRPCAASGKFTLKSGRVVECETLPNFVQTSVDNCLFFLLKFVHYQFK